MTIITTQSRITYAGDGVSTSFPIPFEFFLNSDITAVKTAVGGAVTTLVQTVDYNLSGANTPSGGTALKTTALLIGETLAFFLNPPIEQESHYPSNNPFPASTLENDLDRQTQVSQRLNDILSRSLRAPDGDPGIGTVGFLLPSSIARANTFLTFDANGNPAVAVTLPGGTLSLASITALTGAQTPAEAAASVTPTAKQYLEGDIRRYGALTANSDNSAFLQAAINQALKGGSPVRIPVGTWNYATGLTVNGPIQISGDDMYTSILRKTANVVGMSISDGGSPGQVSLQGFTLSSAGGDSSVGLSINTIGRVRVRQFQAGGLGAGHGSHGIELVQCTVGRFDDVSAVSNAGDGIKLTGSGGVQANANTFTNIDARGNTGWGMNFLSAMANMGTGITVQSNTAGGVQMGACFGNILDVYAESNTGADISFTAACVAPSFGGNLARMAFIATGITFNGASAAVNAVYTARNGAAFQPGNSQVITDNLVFSNTSTQGVGVNGVFTASHSVANELDIVASATAATVLTKFSNANGSFTHIVQADNFRTVAAASNPGTGVSYGGTHATTVGAAGAATALPATPLGYIIANVDGAQVKIPYYNN